MATIDGVLLTRNDGSEEFDLPTTKVDKTYSAGLVTDSIVSGLREVVGGKLVFDKETLVVEGEIHGVDAAQYPNSGTYADHDLGMERELDRAGKEWGWDESDGFDTLTWGDRATINGVITQVDAVENTEDPELGAGAYSFTVEFTYLDAFIS
jgi:hypothetical protein